MTVNDKGLIEVQNNQGSRQKQNTVKKLRSLFCH